MKRTFVQRSGCAPIHQPHTQSGSTSRELRKSLAKIVQKTARLLVVGVVLAGLALFGTSMKVHAQFNYNNSFQTNIVGDGTRPNQLVLGLYNNTQGTTNIINNGNLNTLGVFNNTDGTVNIQDSGTMRVGGYLNNTDGSLTIGDSGRIDIVGYLSNSGGTIHNDGSLSVNSLLNNGNAAGNGMYNTASFINGGSGAITPGSGQGDGILTINGNLINNDGTFVIGLNGQNNDLIEVNGNAVINDGTVEVNFSDGLYGANDKYTFLTADQLSVNGMISTTTNQSIFDFEFDNNSTDWFFTLNRKYNYKSFGKTFNQQMVGKYLNAIVDGGLYYDNDTWNVISDFGNQSNDQKLFALDQMSGAIYGTIAKSSITNTSLANNTLHDILRRNAFGCGCGSDADCTCEQCGTTGVKGSFCRNAWGLAYGTGGYTQYDGNAYGYDQTFFGTLIGIDRLYGCSTRSGVYASYGEGRISSDLMERSKSKELLAGLYLRRQMAIGYMLLSGGFGYNQYDTERAITFVNRKTTNKHSAFVGTVYGERGLDIQREYVKLQPFVGLQYIGNQQEGFTERGANSLNLVGNITTAHSFRSLLGTRVSSNLARVKCGTLSLSGQAYWMHEFLDAYSDFTAQFSNPNHVNFSSNAKFTVRGNDAGRDWAVIGTGLNYDRGNWRLFTGYDITMNSKQVLHTGNAGLAYGW